MRLGLGHGLDVGYRPELFSNVPLLDTYSGAAAAYSLRKLRSGVTSVVRVRRSSDNAEADFTAAEVSDGTLTTWTGANDGFVVTWYDQSGNGNNSTQATAASQPKIVSAGSLVTENGKPAVEFDGTDDYLQAGYKANIANISAFVVQKRISTALNDMTVMISEGANKQIYMHWGKIDGAFTGFNYCYNINTSVVTVTANTNQELASIAINNSGGGIYINGSSILAIGTQIIATSDQNLTIGAYYTGTVPADVRVQELVIYESDNVNNRAAIEAAINSHYSIY